MVDQGTGSSKKDLQDAICVVNKNGVTESKTETSKDPMMVNKMIIAMVLTIGPIEFSAKAERQMDKVEMVRKAR